MKMKYWSDYDKYICMVHGEGILPKGVRLGYEAFLEFKRVKEVIIKLSQQTGNNYSHNDTIYKRPITSSRALQVLDNIEKCRWDEDIRVVAKQIKAGDMISPRDKRRN